MKKKVIGIILIVLSVISLFVGIVFLSTFGILGGVFGFVGKNTSTLHVDNGATVEETQGFIVSTDNNRTTILYEVDGYDYEITLNVNNSAYEKGTAVTVKYDSSNPENCIVPELYEVFGTLGSVFKVVGIVIGVLGIVVGISLLVVGIILLKKYKAEINAQKVNNDPI